MKVVILAGGLGTRLGEITKKIPKPMVTVAGKPLISHLIDIFYNQGYKHFVIAAGYKRNYIINYFKTMNSSTYYKKDNNFFFSFPKDLKIDVIDTGENTMTGGRIKKIKKFIDDDNFIMTYGDGLSDVNINKLVDFHMKNKKIATVTAVKPPARFGALTISNNLVRQFREKNITDESWINGGFFVLNKKIFNYIRSSNTFFEKEPLTTLSVESELSAFKHKGFWQCVDTQRDLQTLEHIFKIYKKWTF